MTNKVSILYIIYLFLKFKSKKLNLRPKTINQSAGIEKNETIFRQKLVSRKTVVTLDLWGDFGPNKKIYIL